MATPDEKTQSGDDDDDDDDTNPLALQRLTVLPDASIEAQDLGRVLYGVQLLAVDRLDGDSTPDFIVSDEHGSSIIFGGQDSGTFLAMEKIANLGALRQALTLDLDNDGDLDVLGVTRLPGFAADCLVMAENEDSRSFRAHVSHQGKSCGVEAHWVLTAAVGANQGVVVVAIQGSTVGDGAADFVTTLRWQEGWRLERLSAAELTHDPNHLLPKPLAATFADLDGDGRKDIVVGHRFNAYSYPSGQPDPGWPGLHLSVFNVDDQAIVTTNPKSTEILQEVVPGTFVDVDGNGALEYVFQDRSRLSALKNRGDAVLHETEVLVEQPVHEEKCEAALGTVDVDDDGVPELVTRRCLLKQSSSGYEITASFEVQHRGGSLLRVHDGVATIYTLGKPTPR